MLKKADKLIPVLMIFILLFGLIVPVTVEAGDPTQVQTTIAYARSLLGSTKYDGYCQRYVRLCYEAAGIYSNVGIAYAYQAKDMWMVSSSKTEIPIGAVLYFNTSEGGHSAIYLGENRMIHALETVVEQEISPGFWAIYAGWGWQAGIEPTGAYLDSEKVFNEEKVISSVSIYKLPAKKFYKMGEEIEVEGLSLIITYTDNSTEIVSEGVTLINRTASIIGRNYIDMEYEGFGLSFPIIVLSGTDEPIIENTNILKYEKSSSQLEISTDRFCVDDIVSLLPEGFFQYNVNGNIKQSGEVATGDYFMHESRNIVIAAVRKGDIDGNGVLNPSDYIILKRIALKTIKVDDVFMEACDVNGDGKTNSFDYIILKRYLLGTTELFN